jgi:hypothetical protein
VFAATHAFIASPIGLLLLFGWSVAFFYHLQTISGAAEMADAPQHVFIARAVAFDKERVFAIASSLGRARHAV